MCCLHLSVSRPSPFLSCVFRFFIAMSLRRRRAHFIVINKRTITTCERISISCKSLFAHSGSCRTYTPDLRVQQHRRVPPNFNVQMGEAIRAPANSKTPLFNMCKSFDLQFHCTWRCRRLHSNQCHACHLCIFDGHRWCSAEKDIEPRTTCVQERTNNIEMQEEIVCVWSMDSVVEQKRLNSLEAVARSDETQTRIV